MAESFLDSLTERYNTLTRSEKKLAGHIFANATKVQYLSINSLAEDSGVSQATITRFCRKMGLSGYHNLKIALAKSDRAAHSGTTGPESGLPSEEEDDLSAVCRRLCDSYQSSLRETMEQLQPDSFRRAVTLLFSNICCK